MSRVAVLAIALALVSACSEENSNDSANTTISTTDVKVTENISSSKVDVKEQLSDEDTVNEVIRSIKEIKGKTGPISDEINKAINSYKSELKLSDEDINKLAKNLGEAAKQAGEGMKVLENSISIFTKEIQKGFDEGYNKNALNSKKSK